MRFNHFWEDDFKLQHTLSFGISINPSTQSVLLHMVACVLLSFLLLLPSVALAQLGGINIESARIIDSGPESIYVEIIVSNNGKLDDVFIGANAQLSPEREKHGYRANFLPVSEKNQIRVIVFRPTPHKGLQTHFLNVFAFQGGKWMIFLNRWLKLEHSWADLPEGAAPQETSAPSSTQLEGINIESVKIIGSSPASITVEVTADNNSGLNHVFLGAHAQSSSPEDTSSEQDYRLAYLPIGQKTQIPVTVQRPTQRKELQTHFLNVIVQQDDEPTLLHRSFNLEHSWADLPDNAADQETHPPSLAQLGGIHIESAKIISSNPTSISVEVTTSYNGQRGGVLIGAYAQSSPPEDADLSFTSPFLDVGEKNRISLIVQRPPQRKGLATDVINVFVSENWGPVVLSRSFKLEHSWEDMPDHIPNPPIPTDKEVGEYPFQEIFDAIRRRDFNSMDALATKWSTSQERDPNGILKLGAIPAYFSHSRCLAELAILPDWQKQNPQSILPLVAEARCRSECYSTLQDGMDPLAIEVAQKELSRVKEALLRTKENAANNPLWYDAYLNVAIALKEDEKTTNEIFEDAIKKFPQYDFLYLTMASRLFKGQRHIREIKKLNQLADRFVKTTTIKEGRAGYARMYSYIDSELWEVNVFRDGVFSWEKNKRGI